MVDVTSGTPTGQVFNTDATGFVVHDAAGNSGPARFIFASENGGIDGWNPAVGATGTAPSTVTEVAVTNGANAVYKGLAIATASDGHTYLYAANFRSGRVEVYDDTFTPVELPGGLFVDRADPGRLRAVQRPGARRPALRHLREAGRHPARRRRRHGHGFVDVFTNDGALVRRLVTRGVLDSPWGLALAPEGFGRFGGALLVGNFGNGRINAFNPATGAPRGSAARAHGQPDRHRRAVGAAVRQRQRRQDRRAAVQRGTGRRVARSARQARGRSLGAGPASVGGVAAPDRGHPADGPHEQTGWAHAARTTRRTRPARRRTLRAATRAGQTVAAPRVRRRRPSM